MVLLHSLFVCREIFTLKLNRADVSLSNEDEGLTRRFAKEISK